MSDSALGFGDESWDESKATVFNTLREHEKILKGNGKNGVIDDVQEFKLKLNSIETFGKTSAFWARVVGWMIIAGVPTIALILAFKKG